MTDAYDVVQAGRSQTKISTTALIKGLVSDFQELHGDRQHADDPALIGGIGWLGAIPVTVLATNKGQTLAESQACHFGCVSPEGYRKATRLMRQADKFHRPILALINTPGAYPGVSAEYLGQGAAIAQCLMTGLNTPVPFLSLIFGEAGSGGALALASGDDVWMTAASTYSVLSPEGYASILWRDSQLAAQAAGKMRLTPPDLLADKMIERIVPEITTANLADLQAAIIERVTTLNQEAPDERLARRHARYRKF